MIASREVDIYVNHYGTRVIVPAVQYDSGRRVVFRIVDSEIPSGSTAYIFIRKPSGKSVYSTGIVSGNTVWVTLSNQDLAECGLAKAQVRINKSDEVITSFEVIFDIKPSYVDNAEESKSGVTPGRLIDDVAEVKARMDAYTFNNEELSDIRVGIDGTSYENAGTAVREQIKALKSQVNSMSTKHDSDMADVDDDIDAVDSKVNSLKEDYYVTKEYLVSEIADVREESSTISDSMNSLESEYTSNKAYVQSEITDLKKKTSAFTDVIVVDRYGTGDYTSLTKALFDNVDSGIKIRVLPGTYDLVSEYETLFGESAVKSMKDSDNTKFKGFQYGIIIRNREIEFMPGAFVVCNWTGRTIDDTHRFSAVRVDYNAKIIGLNLVATATMYAIHDDYGIGDPYTVEYENCYIEGKLLLNANCIGGGCKTYSRHILKNCYFNNNASNSSTVRYHNTSVAGAVPEIFVSNCYFNSWFTANWYGSQTSKMRVYVNNCEAESIHKVAEAASAYNVDNIELYKWCNNEFSPVF